MEMYFTNNNDEKIINFNDVTRREITKLYERTVLYTKDNYKAIEKIGESLLEIYDESEESFNYYIQTMISSTYMMFINQVKNNTLNEEDRISFNIIQYIISNPSEMKDYISSKAGIFEDLVNKTVLFEKLSILGRSTVVQDSQEYMQDIISLAPLSAFDFLRYTKAVKPQEFVKYYIETLDISITDPDIVVDNITNYMRHLYLFNRESYLDNLKEMAKVFYKWIKYQKSINEIDSEELIYCLDIIESSDEDRLCELSILDNHILFNIIYEYCYHSTSGGISVKNKFIPEEDVDEFIKDKLPDSLKENKTKIKNNA